MPKPTITPLKELEIQPPELGEAERYLAREIRTMGTVLVANQVAIANHLATLNGTVTKHVDQIHALDTRVFLLERHAQTDEQRDAQKQTTTDTLTTGVLDLSRMQIKQWAPIIAAFALVIIAIAVMLSGGKVDPTMILPLIP